MFLLHIVAATKKNQQQIHADDKNLVEALAADEGSAVARLLPLSKGGKPATAEKPWLWQIRFSVLHENGLALQRRLMFRGETVFKLEGAIVRPDTCPMRKFEKRIANSTVL